MDEMSEHMRRAVAAGREEIRRGDYLNMDDAMAAGMQAAVEAWRVSESNVEGIRDRLEREFLDRVHGLCLYWLTLDKPTKETVDGVMHSLLVLLDGCGALQGIELWMTDEDTGMRLDVSGALHELRQRVS